MANDNGGRDNVSVILVQGAAGLSGRDTWLWARSCVVQVTFTGTGSYGQTDTQHGWSGAEGNSALTKERTTIGRKPHNDIQIDNLAVSGEHAVIVTILNDSFLEDLGSTNGTWSTETADQEALPAEQRRRRTRQVQAEVHQRSDAPARVRRISRRPWCCART
jgi:hypothetical protein